jgi:hypothetical protein
MSQKKNSSSQIIIFSIIFFILGAIGTNIYLSNQTEHKPSGIITNDFAKNIQKVNGLLVFIHCEPAKSYKVISQIPGKDAVDFIQNTGIGKEKFGAVLGNIFKGIEGLSFEEKLNAFTLKAQNDYKDNVDGIIISGALNEATVIKFQ